MKNKKAKTAYQEKVLVMIEEAERISISSIQRKLKCSFLKSCELMKWLEEQNLIDKWDAISNIKVK